MAEPTDAYAVQPESLQAALWGLYYSIYFGTPDDLKRLPEPVLRAYCEVQRHVRAELAEAVARLGETTANDEGGESRG